MNIVERAIVVCWLVCGFLGYIASVAVFKRLFVGDRKMSPLIDQCVSFVVAFLGPVGLLTLFLLSRNEGVTLFSKTKTE